MNWIIAIVFLGHCIVFSQGGLREVIGVCCNMGREYANQDSYCNDLEHFPLFQINEPDRPHCRKIASACCDDENPRLKCEAGLQHRATIGSCNGIRRDKCVSTENDCCNCCELGMQAYFDGAPCEMTTLGEKCNYAFTTCCKKAMAVHDVDECAIPVEYNNLGGNAALHGKRCQQRCVNIIGRFTCECEEGMTVGADGWTCEPGTGPGPIPNLCANAPCEHECQSTSRTYQCYCRGGYILNSDGFSCSREQPPDPHYDSCETAPCTQECQSNGGNYQCSCRQGYQLEQDGVTCRADRPADLCATASCNQDCQSNGATYQCYCYHGFRLDTDDHTCIDDTPVDLCATAPCTQDCQSNGATYRCYCNPGFRLQADQFTCADDTPVDLCAMARCTQECQSNGATYRCYCNPGFRLQGDGFTCEADQPVDLCATAPCTQDCHSNGATYQCSCRQNYQLDSNQYSCRALRPTGDPCDTAPCEQECRSNSVIYQCSCNRGYLLQDDGFSCIDENECETGYYQCRPGERCVNNEGGYTCEAGSQCSEPGYAFDEISGRCTDIDECETTPDICELYQECINYDGHYYCHSLCSRGYQVIRDEANNRHTCQDIDECLINTHDCAVSQRCDNLPGSYQCTRTTPCGTGYSVNGVSQECEDIDECRLNLHDCDAYYACNNTLGSFRCEPCPPGFRVTPSLNVCNVDINECIDPNICDGGSRCENTYGSYKCASLCGDGFEYNPYQRKCIDIDECVRGTHTCGPNQACKNTINSFSCSCLEGFHYNFDTQTCFDMDECAEGDRIGRPKCRPHERCENVPGSHRCTPACRFGQKFQQFGSQWNCTDLNECLLGTHNCRSDEICVNDEYDGTFRCVRCTRGTRFNAITKTCDDIDECANPSGRVCLGVCKNTPGSFYCNCPTGYSMIQSRVCRDIDECQVGTHRCTRDQLCFNTKGAHKCMNITCPPHYNKRITGRQMRCDKIQQQLCPPPHLDTHNCRGNRTSPIIYFPLALRSYAELPAPQDVLTLRIPAPANIIDFRLDYGNERGIFEVEKRQSHQTEGVLKLVRPIQGEYSTEVHMSIRTDTSSFGQRPNWIETSKAIILVDVSRHDF